MTDQTSRGYRMKARAESKARTRRRIIEATVDLHATVGPAFTEISEVARRAGVRRVTVYSHFPDEAALLGACSAHWRGLHPAPDPSRWSGVAQPQRVQAALVDLYRWYRETEPMTANVLRDMERLPALRQIIESGLGRYLDHVHALLLSALDPPEESRQRLAAVLRVAMAFPTWRALADLGDDKAASLAAGFVGLARTDE